MNDGQQGVSLPTPRRPGSVWTGTSTSSLAPSVLPAATSIVIITRDRCDSLARTLDRLAGLAGVHEIIVVDNATHGDTVADVCRRYPQVRFISLGRNLGAAARNVGVEAANTPYVAFCDDDSWWAPDAVERASAYFERYPGVALIAGKVLVGPDERLDPVSALLSISPLPAIVPMSGPAILGYLACGAIVRRSVFLELGGFSSLFGLGGEEQLLAIDLAEAGWGLTYAEDLVAYHYPSPNRDTCRRQRIESRNAVWVGWMRRPGRSALQISWRACRCSWGNRCIGRGVLDVVRGMPRVLRQRRVVSPWLERQLRQLESLEDPE